MREYELTVVYDLAVQETGGPDAGPERLTSLIEGRGGKMLKIDHWGRRRMAYPINRALDGDYIVTRIDFDPSAVASLEAALKIDEKVYRFLTVRADELPPPPPPREPREPRPVPAAETATAAPEAVAEAAPVAETPAEPAPAVEETPEAPAAAATPAAEEPAAEAQAESATDEKPTDPSAEG